MVQSGLLILWFSDARVKLNTLRLRQDGRRFPDDTFERIFLKENVIILIKISLKFVPNGPIDNITALVERLAWRRPGDKPLSEPMMVRLPTHICVTRPQWVKMSIDEPHYIFIWWMFSNCICLAMRRWCEQNRFNRWTIHSLHSVYKYSIYQKDAMKGQWPFLHNIFW